MHSDPNHVHLPVKVLKDASMNTTASQNTQQTHLFCIKTLKFLGTEDAYTAFGPTIWQNWQLSG
jgi:hypothetical protein